MPIQKITISTDQVLADLKNFITFLNALESILPDSIVQEGATEALDAIANSPVLLQLLVNALQRI
jgi:hypothetical protein